MTRIVCILVILFALLCSTAAQSEPQAVQAVDTSMMQRDDYIRASIIVATPASEVYSVFGHCALRLSCPSQQMDFCFTFETPADSKGLASFLGGKAMGGFMAAQTQHYLATYSQAGRGMSEHELNLTPQEKLRLWQLVDEEIAQGFSRRYDYMHTQCTSMLVNIVYRALAKPVVYQVLPTELDGSFRDMMLQAARHANYPWSEFFWQTIMGPEGDETSPLEQKLTPAMLPTMWRQTTVSDTSRRLIEAEPKTLTEQASQRSVAQSEWTSPTAVFTLLLIIVLCITFAQWRMGLQRLPRLLDVVLLLLHTIASMTLMWLWLFSSLEATEWNWYLPTFNLVPLLLWLLNRQWLRTICRIYLGVLLAMLLLTPVVPQLDLPHALITAILAVRVLMKTKN